MAMKQEDVAYGQRIRINLPGVGNHGQVGTIKRVRGGMCSIHLDWDQRPQHVVMFYAGDLDLVADKLQVDATPSTPEDSV
jgi:hypothetical protein